ncbi:MAG: tRNA (guanosine(46)-N7)-methyltransferase TrmB [Clostridia bacterium]|nr:tRNA (guanosine(46)-N7)-methyltransferase TrmB [Clostridia bacterium]
MRMRRKKHLDERLEICNEYLVETDRSIANVTLANQSKDYIDYRELFYNSNPVNLEIGCGKGGFIVKTALKIANENFIAVEMMQNIIVMAMEKAKNANLKNVVFMNTGAEYLPRYIKPNSIKTIYLNFSPPFPQKSYECRRLTNERNATNYYDFLCAGGKLIQKTDDKDFFEYSFNMLKKVGFEVVDTSDLVLFDKDNVKTEYEEKFLAKSMKIYRLIATKN